MPDKSIQLSNDKKAIPERDVFSPSQEDLFAAEDHLRVFQGLIIGILLSPLTWLIIFLVIRACFL